jgi:prepilin-type N-terminal cleavage/methylation domain-containing protein
MLNKGFTLLELIVVIIIIGVLATLGYTQYTTIVEKGRVAEAIARIGFMRKLTYEYYIKNGSLIGIQNSNVEVDNTCSSSFFYRYYVGGQPLAGYVALEAARCTTGGKSPNASREYVYYLQFFPDTGQQSWHCAYQDDYTSCFGLPPSIE